MTNLTNIELTTMKAEELRTIAKEFQMTGAWKAKKNEMIEFLEVKKAEQIEEARIAALALQPEIVEEEKPQNSRRGRTRTIEVYKDGELFNTIEGLIETLKWAVENNICNQGWVKSSLKTGRETVAGRKFKEGGFLFKYAN
jgi:hypothetical protein